MPQTLPPLTQGVPIVDEGGTPNLFLLLRWQDLISSFTLTPTKAAIPATDTVLTDALATTVIFTTAQGGNYEVGYYIRKTVADGVSSSLTVTIGWTENGQALTRVFTALATDAVTANQSAVIPILADASSNITIAIAYASNTPNTMAYRYRAVLKQLA